MHEAICSVCGYKLKRCSYWKAKVDIKRHVEEKHPSRFFSDSDFNRTIDKQILQLKKQRRQSYTVQ